MIYIQKKKLSDSLNGRIIELKKSPDWKTIDAHDTNAIRTFFDDRFPKEEIKKALVNEQHGLCAYCMKRIKNDNHTTLEHYIPIKSEKSKALDYSNLFAVCSGGRDVTEAENTVLCCDAHKKEEIISTSPLNKEQMKKISYKSNGEIFTDPEDITMESDLNNVLGLNGKRNPDGSFCSDTSTQLVKGRKDAYDRARRMVTSLNKDGICTSGNVKALMDKACTGDEWEEFVGVKLFYLGRKYQSLKKRRL